MLLGGFHLNLKDIAIVFTLVGGILRLVEGFYYLLIFLPWIMSIMYFNPTILMIPSLFWSNIIPIAIAFINAILILAVTPFIYRKPIGAGVALIIFTIIGFFSVGGILALIGGTLTLIHVEQSQKVRRKALPPRVTRLPLPPRVK